MNAAQPWVRPSRSVFEASGMQPPSKHQSRFTHQYLKSQLELDAQEVHMVEEIFTDLYTRDEISAMTLEDIDDKASFWKVCGRIWCRLLKHLWAEEWNRQILNPPLYDSLRIVTSEAFGVILNLHHAISNPTSSVIPDAGLEVTAVAQHAGFLPFSLASSAPPPPPGSNSELVLLPQTTLFPEDGDGTEQTSYETLFIKILGIAKTGRVMAPELICYYFYNLVKAKKDKVKTKVRQKQRPTGGMMEGTGTGSAMGIGIGGTGLKQTIASVLEEVLHERGVATKDDLKRLLSKDDMVSMMNRISLDKEENDGTCLSRCERGAQGGPD